MSATQDFVRKQSTGDPFTKLVLKVIADYANWQTGSCYPSISTLANDCECSERTVQRRLQELSELGFITVQQKSGQSHLITLVGYQQWFEALPVRTLPRGDCQSGVTAGPKGVTASHQGGDCGTPEIYNINILNNSFKKGLEDSSATSVSDDDRVFYVDGQLRLCDSLNTFWLSQFGNLQDDLNLALIQVSGYVQPNSKSHSLEKQVSAQLAKIVRDRKERDRRYQSSKTNSSNGKATSDPAKKQSYDKNASEFWAKVDRGEIKI